MNAQFIMINLGIHLYFNQSSFTIFIIAFFNYFLLLSLKFYLLPMIA